MNSVLERRKLKLINLNGLPWGPCIRLLERPNDRENVGVRITEREFESQVGHSLAG